MIQALRNSAFFTRVIVCILVSFGSQSLLIYRRTCSKASGRASGPWDSTERSWSHHVIQIEFWGTRIIEWIIHVSWFCMSNFLQNKNFSAIFSVLFSTQAKNKSCNIIVCLSFKTGNYFTHYQSFFFTVFIEWYSQDDRGGEAGTLGTAQGLGKGTFSAARSSIGSYSLCDGR